MLIVRVVSAFLFYPSSIHCQNQPPRDIISLESMLVGVFLAHGYSIHSTCAEIAFVGRLWTICEGVELGTSGTWIGVTEYKPFGTDDGTDVFNKIGTCSVVPLNAAMATC